MIVGIGIDMMEVDRVREKITKENGFREQVFSTGEIEYCEKQGDPFQHYAARFCAKEAFLKAAGVGLSIGFSVSEITIVSSEAGQPEIYLEGQYKKLGFDNKWKNFHVSLTHLKDIASAIVIIEK